MNDPSSTISKPSPPNRRQFERFDVRDQHLIAFNSEDISKVIDISAKGFSCFVSDRAYQNFKMGDAYEARLRYVGETFDVTIKVAWKEEQSVGFELCNLNEVTASFFNRLIKPLSLAKSLTLVDASFLQEGSGKKTWYHGDEGTDLMLWRGQNGDIEAWQLVFEKQFIEWNYGRGLTTGIVTKRSSLEAGLAIPSDELLEKDQTISKQCYVQAIDLLMALGNEDARDILPTLTEE